MKQKKLLRLDEFLDMRIPADREGQFMRVEGFIQQNPEDGKPASQPLENSLSKAMSATANCRHVRPSSVDTSSR